MKVTTHPLPRSETGVHCALEVVDGGRHAFDGLAPRAASPGCSA